MVAPAAVHAQKALEWDHLLTLIWPDLLVWPGNHFYGDITTQHPPWAAVALLSGVWESGFNYKETAFAIGIPPLLLALLGCRRQPGVFFAIAAGIGLLFALAPPGILQLTAWIPGAFTRL